MKNKPSIWRQGFWFSLVFSAFYAFGSGSNFSPSTLLIGFLFWWALGALAVKVFRFFDRKH